VREEDPSELIAPVLTDYVLVETLTLFNAPLYRQGRWANYVTIREPFLDGARVLAERDYDPQIPGNMRHANSSTLLL
jgi:hypothetical protein